MRKNLKKKILTIIEKFGPELFQNFEKERLIKRKGAEVAGDGDFDSDLDITDYHLELELNNAFESLKEKGV